MKVRGGFTLIELLVVMVVIAMLAAMTAGALQQTRNAARTSKTKATLTKLHNVLMRKYESYETRRVPISSVKANGTPMSPREVAQMRLDAIRDLMRMEMPDRWTDIMDAPVKFSWGSLPRPAISQLYLQKYNANKPDTTAAPSSGQPGYGPAECLYLTVMSGGADMREMFKQDEIGDVDGDGWKEFIDGWGNPIMWLRWAPGFTPNSFIQVNDTTTTDAHHDALDPMKLDKTAYDLKPLIYSSAGSKTDYGLDVDQDYRYASAKPPSPYTTKAGTLVGRMPMTNQTMKGD
jgi:prepilin-type N-terminal cleavage/methylation domain-containing protein